MVWDKIEETETGRKLLLISQKELDRLRGPNADNPNPCVRLYGLGPAGVKCGECKWLEEFHQSRSWYKCQLRKTRTGSMGGPSYDHRVRWQACARFEQKEEESNG